MDEKFVLTGVSVKRNFQLSAMIYIANDRNVFDTTKYCASIIYGWVKDKFPSLELDNRVRSGSKNRYDQKVDIIYNIKEPYFCLNAQHADREVPIRIWTIEAEIISDGEKLRLGVRISYTTPVGQDLPTPSFTVPKFVRRISTQVGLIDVRRIEPNVKLIESQEDVDKLYELLIDNDRLLPIILVAEKSKSDDIGGEYTSGYLLDVDNLCKKVGMISHVYKISKDNILKWNQKVGIEFRLTEGSIRTYNPCFDIILDQAYRHPYSTVNRIMAANYVDDTGHDHVAGNAYAYILAKRIIDRSLRDRIDWSGLGHKFYFVAHRDMMKNAEKGLENTSEQIKLLEELNEELERKIKSQENDILTAWLEKDHIAKQLDEEKRISFSLRSRLNQLKELLADRGMDEEIVIPKDYSQLIEWVHKYYSDKIIVHPRARRGLKDAEFEDVELVYCCLKLLGDDYVSMRRGDITRVDFDKKCAELGVEESGAISDNRAGELGDTYFLDYRNSKIKLDRHIVKGNATRDPKAILRIYFFWDDEEEKVVIGWLPSHLKIRTS